MLHISTWFRLVLQQRVNWFRSSLHLDVANNNSFCFDWQCHITYHLFSGPLSGWVIGLNVETVNCLKEKIHLVPERSQNKVSTPCWGPWSLPLIYLKTFIHLIIKVWWWPLFPAVFTYSHGDVKGEVIADLTWSPAAWFSCSRLRAPISTPPSTIEPKYDSATGYSPQSVWLEQPVDLNNKWHIRHLQSFQLKCYS